VAEASDAGGRSYASREEVGRRGNGNGLGAAQPMAHGGCIELIWGRLGIFFVEDGDENVGGSHLSESARFRVDRCILVFHALGHVSIAASGRSERRDRPGDT
jgi:hypothetical protein